MDLPEDAAKIGRKAGVGSDMSGSTMWTLPPTGLNASAESCTSHRRTFPTSAAFQSSPDPQTARLALFKSLSPGHEQPAEPGAPGRVGWHELLAADWEKALAFYGELFGWRKRTPTSAMTGTYQLFSAGGQTIGGMLTKPADDAGPLLALLFPTSAISMLRAQRVKSRWRPDPRRPV